MSSTEFNPRYRNGHEYRTNRAIVLAQSDVCGICAHIGARTCDHIIGWERWIDMYGSIDGWNGLSNLQPAHGMLSNPLRYNYCPVCGRLCNESKSHNVIEPMPRSRVW